MATDAPIIGGVATLLGTDTAQALDSSDTPCRQLSIRAHATNEELSIGHSDVDAATRFAYLLALENYTIGPFPAGQGVRPCDIYISGAQGDAVTWSGYKW